MFESILVYVGNALGNIVAEKRPSFIVSPKD